MRVATRIGWPTRRELTGEIFEYIEGFCNPIRRHSTLGMLSASERHVDERSALFVPIKGVMAGGARVRRGLELARRLSWRLPRGRSLEDDVWNARHRGIVTLLWLHAFAWPLVSLAFSDPLLHAIGHGTALAASAVAANHFASRLARAVVASFGLLTASALLVHITGGLTEAHFHFFVMISVVTLYEEWRTFLLAFAYVVSHHALMGTVMPEAVFDHADASLASWQWAGIHGGFVLAAGVANVVAWRANETATERRTLSERERADDAQRKFGALVEATDDAVIGKTRDGTVTSWNGGAERLFGRSAAEMLGQSVMTLVPVERHAEEIQLMEQAIADGRLDHYDTTRLHVGGQEIDVSLTLSVVRDRTGGEPELVSVERDITEAKRRERERALQAKHLETLALVDHLTGLGNTRHFHSALEAEIARGQRHGDRFALVVFDLDGFKGINDALGHAEGDRVLSRFGELLRGADRGGDVACRLGGDEFGLILPLGGREGATTAAERLRTSLREERSDVDVSFGVSLWPDDADDKDELIARADAGMYAEKAARPGRLNHYRLSR